MKKKEKKMWKKLGKEGKWWQIRKRSEKQNNKKNKQLVK